MYGLRRVCACLFVLAGRLFNGPSMAANCLPSPGSIWHTRSIELSAPLAFFRLKRKITRPVWWTVHAHKSFAGPHMENELCSDYGPVYRLRFSSFTVVS